MGTRICSRFLIGAAAVALVACTDHAPTGTVNDATLHALGDAGSASFAVVGVVTAATEDALKPLLEAEKQRIAAEQKRSQQAYDSLKVVWDDYLHNPSAYKSRLIMCDPLAYKAEAKIIGPAGGEISIGPHELSIPKGALSSYVVITGEMPVSLLVSVKLSPHGLTFRSAPSLKLNYQHCYRSPSLIERVAYINDALQIVEWPRSSDSREGVVTSWILHFSAYAVAY